jgi:multiple sugar transport system substrate-binding protein
MKMRRNAIFSVLLIVLVIIAACAPAAAPAPQTGAGEAAATAAEGTESTEGAAGVPAATIRVGTWESGDSANQWNQLIADFNQEYPQIEVSFEPVPDNYGTKLLTQIAAGDAPDVFQVGDGDVRMFVERGGAADLSEYVAGKGDLPGLDTSVFYESLHNTGVVDGKPYFLTKDYSPLVVYYNKDLFDAAGVPYPEDGWTWEQFRDAAIKLTSGSGATAQYGVDLPGNWIRAIEPFVFSNGGDLMSEDGTQIVGHLNSPETVEAIQFYIDLYTKDNVAPSAADKTTTFAGVDLFQTGRVAMNWTGRWPLADYEENPNLNFGVVGLPQSKERANAICWAGLGLYQGSNNPDQAWLFLRHIGGEAGQRVFGAHGLPSMPAVTEELGLASNEHTAPVLNEVQHLKPLPDMRTRWYNDSVAKYLTEALDKLLAEGGDVQAALDDAAQKAQAELDKLAAQEE